MASLLSALTNWLLFGSLVIALGSIAARWVFIPRAAVSLGDAEGRATGPDASGAAEGRSSSFEGSGADPRSRLEAVAARMGLLAALLLPVAMLMVYGRQLYEFRDPFAPWMEEAQLLLTGTAWGQTWMAATGISVVALVGFGLVRAGLSSGWLLASLTTIGVAAYPAFSGHASGTEGLRGLTITADVLHVLAAGAWVGGLAFVLSAERAWRKQSDEDDATLLPILVPIFSPFAIAAVATLIASGAIASWVHVGSVGGLIGTGYGRLLALKLGVVGLVLALGALNWRRLTPQLGTPEGQGAMRRSAATELLLAQVVLVVTAVLVRTAPMGH